MDSTKDSQTLIETLFSQITPESLPDFSQDRIDNFFEIIEEFNEIHQGNGKAEEVPDFELKIKELKDFSLKVKDIQEISLNFFDLLKLFAANIKEIETILQPPSQKNQESDTQSIIESLLSSLTPETFPQLTQEKVDDLFNIIEEVNEVYQGNQKTKEIMNFEDKIKELKEVLLITKSHEEIHRDYLNLLEIFANKIEEIKHSMEQKDEENECHHLLKALKAQIQLVNFPYLLQEQIESFHSLIQKLNKIISQPKLNNDEIPEVFNKVRELWLQIRDHRETNQIFVETIALLENKGASLKEIFRIDEPEVMIEKEKKIEEVSKKEKLKAVELAREKKNLLEYIENAPAAGLNCFYKYQSQLEALGINIPKLCVPNDLPKYPKFSVLKNLEEVKDEREDQEKMFRILIDILPEMQSLGMLRLWKDKNSNVPIVEHYEDAIGLLLHVQTREQFIRSFLQQSLFKDQDNTFTESEVADIREAFSVHNPDSLNEDQNLSTIKDCWVKITSNELATKLANIIFEAAQMNSSLVHFIKDLGTYLQFRNDVKEKKISTENDHKGFEEQKVSDFPVKAAEFTSKDNLLNFPDLPEKTQKETELIKGLLVVEDEDTDYVMIEEKKSEEESDIILDNERSKQVPIQISPQSEIQTTILNPQSLEQKTPSLQEKPQSSFRLSRDSSTPEKEGQDTKFYPDLSHKSKQDIKEVVEILSDKIKRTDSKKLQESPQKRKSEVGKELLNSDKARTEDIVAPNDDSHSIPFKSPVGSIQAASKESFESSDFRRQIELKMKDFSARDEAGPKKLSKQLDTIKVDNVNVMDSVLNSNLDETKDISTLLSENVFLHRFYALNSKNGMNEDRKRRLEEFYNATELISQEYSPQDFEVKEKVTEIKRRIGLELQILFNLSTYIILVLKLCKGFNWQNFKVSCLRYRQSDDEMCPENFAREEDLTRKEDNFSYGLFICTLPLSSWKNFKKNMRLALYMVSEHKLYMDTTLIPFDPLVDCHNKFVFNVKFNAPTSPAQGCDNLFETYIILSHFLGEIEYALLRLDLLNQLESVPFSEDTLTKILLQKPSKYLLNLITNEGFKTNRTHSLCLLGKMVSWKVLFQKDRVLLNSISIVYNTFDLFGLLDQLLTLEGVTRQSLLNYLKCAIVVKMKMQTVKNKAIIGYFARKISRIQTFDDDCFDFIVNVIECIEFGASAYDERANIVNPVISAIERSANIPNKTKLRYLIYLYDDMLRTDMYSTLLKINNALLRVDNEITNITPNPKIIKKIDQIFYKSAFWKTLSNNNIRRILYSFLSSTEIALELRVTIEQSEIQRQFGNYLESIFKTNNTEDVDFLRTVFIDCPNPDLAYYRAEEFISKYVSRGVIDRNCFLSKEASLHFMERFFFPYYSSSQNPAKSMRENLKLWKSLGSLSREEALSFFDNLFQTAENFNNKTKRLEEISDQVCVAFFEHASYFTMALDESGKAVEWKSNSLKESFFNTFFIKLENDNDKKNIKKIAVDKVVEVVLNHENISKDLRNSTLTRASLILADEITYEEIRNTIVKDPSSARLYGSFLRNMSKMSNEKTGSLIRKHLQTVVNDLYSYEITFDELDTIKSYDDQKKKLMFELLEDVNRNIKFDVFLNNLYKLADALQMKILQIDDFLDFFSDNDCIKAKKIKLSKLREALSGRKLSDMILPKEQYEVKAINLDKEFEKFSPIAVKTQSLLSFSFFNQFLAKDIQDEDDLIQSCEQAYTNMVNLFNRVVKQLKDKTLNMALIKQYFFNLQPSRFDKEMEEISKHIHTDSANLGLLKKVLSYYLQSPDFIYISRSLIDFDNVAPLKSQSLTQSLSAYDELAQNLMNGESAEDVLASDYIEAAENLVTELNNFNLKINRVDPINQIIHELSTGKDLCNFLDKVQRDNLNELKDFVNDQEESLISVKVIKELEYVWHFKANIIDKSNGLNDFVSRCSKMLHRNDWFDIQGYDEIQTCIKGCVTAKTSLERTYTEMVNRDASYKFRLMEIMDNSEIQIIHQDNNKKTVLVIPGNYSLKDLNEFKDKALLVITKTKNTNENNENIIDFDTIKKFTELVDALNVILNAYEELENFGFFQKFIQRTEKDSIVFKIRRNNFEEIERCKASVQKYTVQFSSHLLKLYDASYLFAHFYSRQLKTLHSTIMRTEKNWEESAQSLALWANLDFNTFKDEISNIDVQSILNKDPLEQLTFMKDLLDRVGPKFYFNDDRIIGHEQPYVKLVEVKKENAFLGLLAGVSQIEMLDAQLNQILFCHYNTNPLEVTCFLQRAFLNGGRLPHFVLGIEDLSASLQNHFCEKMDSLLKNLHRFKSNVKLIVVGSTTTEKVYNYLYHNKEFKKEVIKNVANEKQYFETLLKMAPNFEILVSKAAGMGKTHTILEQCKVKNLKPIYFPIAGNITPDRIGERLASIEVNQDTSLIIQIHNVADKKILDEILFQLIFFRSLKSNTHLFFPQHKFHLFIELQNLLTENYVASIRSLSIFDVAMVITVINEVDCNKIEIDPTDVKSYFVMHYLKTMEDQKIADTDITYEEFAEGFIQNKAGFRIDPQTYRSLLKKHFFEPLQSVNPSFIQLRFFIDIFYSALRTFGGSPFLMTESLHDAFRNFKPKEITKALRSDFVKILMENSRQFVRRTVSSEGFFAEKANEANKGVNFSEELRNFPLLIMRQGEKEDSDFCYSFVYNDITKVPLEIKKFVVAQELGDRVRYIWDDPAKINEEFSRNDLTTKSPAELLQILMAIAGRQKIKPDDNYAITLDNFYKMCLIIQRMRSRIPIIIMGETGVGKTALIRFLVENIYDDELLILNIHAGITEKDLIEKKVKIQERQAKLKGKRLWVFFDEFNTSEELGYISEVLSSKRFLGEKLDDNLIFLGACNPFRKREANKNVEKVGIEKNKKIPSGDLLYKVLPPPESLIEAMWDYKELREAETLEYIKTMLKIKYRIDKVIDVIYYTHNFIKENIEKSAVSLRDVDRFRRLYDWFAQTMPQKRSMSSVVNRSEVFSNYNMERSERALILTLCFCYYMRLPTVTLRQKYVETVEKKLNFKPGHVLKVLENEQIDLLTRMELPPGTALNRALRENVFSTFVCLMNKIPIIIVGMPGCSKSLSFRLLCTNLRGQNSYEEYFRSLHELSIVYFQGSESVTSEGVEKVFERASRSLKLDKVIPTILFDEIGLAEVSIHNPLKVLHARLEGRPEISFIGLSNWELDAAKMGRFLVVARPLPDVVELHETAVKIFESVLGNGADAFNKRIQTLSNSYSEFIKTWRQKTVSLYPDFFGLRDFYSLIKYISNKIKTEEIAPENRTAVAKMLKRGIERNFDGQARSVNLFLEKVRQDFYDQELVENDELDVLSLIQENLNDPDARCLLLIIRGEALIHMVSQSVNTEGKNVVTIHGSTFEQDKQNEQYNIRVLSEVINHVEKGNVIIFKDVNNSIQTSLYDLYNKAYHRAGGKNYCRVAVGANYNPKCFVHPHFNCIVYINEARLEDIDAPFLNRFEKHYLTLDRFLGEDELYLFNLIKQWMNKILGKYLGNNNSALKRDNFIINSSDEALASLCIKTLQSIRKPVQGAEGEVIPNNQDDDSVNRALKQCKQQLLANTTVDFRFLVETSPEIKNDKTEYEFIREVYKAKYNTKISELCKQANSHLMIFTYDQDISRYIVGDRVKTFKMVNMRCEKDIKDELDAYSQSQERLCVITLDYETEAVHLSLLLFLIDNMEKMNESECPKSFIIILHCSRIAVANSNEKPLRTISFLNGWSQVFLEELSYSAAEIEASPSIHPLIVSDKINLRDLFMNTYQNCIKRFDIKFTSDLENTRSLTGFVKVLLEAIEDKLFQKIATGYLDEKFKNEKNGNINIDWRREIINSKEFANLAWNVSEAAKLYATKKAEEYCAMMMNYLLTNDVFVSLFPSYGVKLLENYIPDIKPMLQRVEFNPEFTMRLISKVFFCSNQQKVRNLVEVFLEYPRLFPCSKIDQARFFDLTNAKEDSKNLYSIATAINDMESRVVLNELDKESNQEEEKNQDDNKLEIEEAKREDISEIHAIDNEDEIQFKAWNTKFKDVLETMTCLTRVEDGVCTFNMYVELESPENQAMKELYLLDMRNEFIEKIAKTSLNGSMLLDKLIRQFLNKDFTVADYLLVLFRGGALWINLLQIYNVLSSLETKDNFIEELFLPNINIEVGFDLGVMLNAQVDYIEAFFEKCAELFAPQKKNIQRMGDSKSYTTVFVNIYFWLIKLQIEFSKYGLTMPITLNIWKNFVELIESISKGNSEEIYNKLDERFVNNVDANLFMNIDNILQELKNTCSEEEKAQISKFQATTLFKLWVANRDEINEDKELAKRLLVRINHDKYFPNFCSNILDQLISTDNQAQIYENLGELEDDVLINFNECFGPIGRATYDDPLSTILTDFFDKYIEDPEIAAIREEESEASELLNANFEKFTEYWALIENQQQNNHIQLLYIMAFFKHYMRAYAECLIEDVKYKILQEIDNYLKRNNFLADSLSVFTLKILRIKLGSYKRLERFLYEVRKMQWIEKFEQSFKEIPDRLLMIPPILNASQDQRNVQAKWTELINSDFSNEGLFTQLITLAGKDHNTRYVLLNLFLTNAYVGSLSQPKINAFKQLMQKHDALLKQHLNEYQIVLIKCYIESKVDQEYLKMEPNLDADETNAHIIVLNVINWMVSLNNFVSPLTSLFFANGKIAENFSNHFQSMFVVSGLDNPFIECAQRAKEACRFRGVYICSAACPYIYTVEGCGWTSEIKFCPFCCENIGNAQGKGTHTLARVDKGARRLGPVLQDTGRYYVGNAELQKDQNYWSNLEGDIDKEMDKMREQKIVKVNQGRIDQPQFANLAMTGYNRMTEKVRDELQTPTLGRIKRCTDHFLRFVLHSSLYVMIALKWISPQEALKIVPAQDLNRLLSYLKDIIQDCLKKLREYLDCNDSLVWIIAMEQFMAVTIQTHHNASFTANTCKNRDRFERVIEQVLDNHLGESKATTIKLYRQTSQVIVQKLDSILQEEELSNDYRFLQILRLVKLPSLDNMVNDYMDIIKTRYPILDECVKNTEQMETVSKLVNIVRFSNELMKLMDFQISRKDAEDTAISDLIERLPKEKVGQMTKLLEGFLESWNSLNLGPIQVECKTVGTTDKYTRKSPVIAFLVDSMQGKNQFGKILSGVIYNLGAQQNEILNQISGRAKNMKQLQNIKLLEDKEVIPQNCGPQDILDLNQDVLEAMVFACSSNNYTYGNGVASYDFEAIQFNLMLKIMGKKLLLQKLDFYPNVKFIGEVFTSKSKFSSHIIDIRNLGLTNPIPNLEELEDKFKLIQERSKNQFYSVLKQVLGSLERIMIFYKTLTKKGVTISEYVREFKFNAISPLLVDEEPIRSYQISVIVSLYEAIEKISTPFTWKIIPNIFKSVELSDNDKKDLDKLFREMQDEKQEAKIMLSLQDLGTAISRFAARCLVLDDENEPQFKPTSELMPMMKEKEDIWPYPCDEESIENLTNKFPNITFNKIFSLNEFIQNRLNPHREGPNPRIEVKENKEIIPEKPVHKKKGAKAKITIYN